MKSVTFSILFISFCCLAERSSAQSMKQFEAEGMTVNWQINANRAYFEMTAPTTGWLCIGFNEDTELKGNYLLMGHVVDGKVEVVEHFVIEEGIYKSLEELGVKSNIKDVEGHEGDGETSIRFSIPVNAKNEYQKDLLAHDFMAMLLAFSDKDDFQHHSTMRKTMNIKM